MQLSFAFSCCSLLYFGFTVSPVVWTLKFYDRTWSIYYLTICNTCVLQRGNFRCLLTPVFYSPFWLFNYLHLNCICYVKLLENTYSILTQGTYIDPVGILEGIGRPVSKVAPGTTWTIQISPLSSAWSMWGGSDKTAWYSPAGTIEIKYGNPRRSAWSPRGRL